MRLAIRVLAVLVATKASRVLVVFLGNLGCEGFLVLPASQVLLALSVCVVLVVYLVSVA